MRMTLDNPDMKKLLPKFMQNDDANMALANSMNQMISEPGKKVKLIRKWDQIEQMSNEELNELAWEFNVDWWDPNLSIERKKAVIKTCYRIHEKRGTKYAVSELIVATFGYGKVAEWFEYGGEPFCFRVETDTVLTEEGLNMFSALIDKVKSARSSLDEVDKKFNLKLDTKVEHATFITRIMRIGTDEM